MKTVRTVVVLAALAVCLLLLSSCRPVEYYMDQVCKIHGRATIAETDPPMPLGSVEVVVNDYYYSDLTNALGDYELEMAEGVWEVSFRKGGFETQTVTVVLSEEDREAEIDVALVMEPLPPPADLTGYWEMNLIWPDGESEGPFPMYFAQDGTTVTSPWGFVGTYVAPVLELEFEDEGELMHFYGEFTGSYLSGPVTMAEGEGSWSLAPADYDGELQVQGAIESEDGTEIAVAEDVQNATGYREAVYHARVISFQTTGAYPQRYEIRCWGRDFAPGAYEVEHVGPDELEDEDPWHELLMIGTADIASPDGQLTIDQYVLGQKIVGSFMGTGGPYFVMSFDLSVGNGGQVEIDAGYGPNTYTVTNVQETVLDYSYAAIEFLDMDTTITIDLANTARLVTGYTYTIFGESSHSPGASMGVWITSGDEEAGGKALSGRLYLSRLDAAGMAGWFDVVLGPEEWDQPTLPPPVGSLKGSFDVDWDYEESF